MCERRWRVSAIRPSAAFEFIIIDDCSTDTTWQILTAYAARDSRIMLIRNEKNIGLTRSMNKGLALER
jgi:glycosyltransferase involved in cell wall biosynthesis